LEAIRIPETAATAAEFAIITPVYMPFGVIGAMSWMTNDDRLDIDRIFDTESAEMHSVARRFITGYRQLRLGACPNAHSYLLTKREIECLHWASLGKTDYETSVILGISMSTVRFHLKNASNKLGSLNRVRAVNLATQMGFVSYADN
jgi:DNA-binding CsgD family transcriptional regulator